MKKYLLLSLFLITASMSQGTIIIVTHASDSGPGSLRQAVINANANTGLDTILFDNSINGFPIILFGIDINITDDLVIDGNGPANTIIVDNGMGYTFEVAANTEATFRDLNISNAQRGISTLNPVGNINIINCRILNCSLQAIYYISNFGNLFVDSCYIRDNANGVWTQNSADYSVTNSTFINNFSSGAIIMAGGFLGNGYFANNTLFQNENGISVVDPEPGKTVVIANNTCYNNNDVGIRIFERNDNGASITLANNISYNNNLDFNLSSTFPIPTGANPSTFRNIVGTCISEYGCPAWYSSSDPMLDSAGPANNGGVSPTIGLTDMSVHAIDSALIGYAPTTDQRGYRRTGNPDIGAIEYNGKLPCTLLTNSINETRCFRYESPSGEYTWTESGTYTDTILSIDGCDSILTINLTINEVDTGVIDLGIQLVAIAGGGTSYQWLNCDLSNAPIDGAIGRSFTAIENGNYAVEITQNGCVDTSSCYAITTVGIFDNDFGESLMVYPNPTSGKISVTVGKTYVHLKAIVRNIFGQIISMNDFESTSQFDLNIEGPQGIYLVEIRTLSGESAIVKVLKE